MQTGAPGEWYLSRDGQTHGPVTDQELRKLVELGHLQATDYVWRDGFQGWVLASEMPGLLQPPPSGPGPAGQAAAAGGPAAPVPGTLQPAHVVLPRSAGEHDQFAGPAETEGSTTLALIAYILHLIPIAILPLIGLVISLLNVGAKPDWLATHFQWQWRTFVKGLLFLIIGGFTAVFMFGYLIILAAVIWSIVRHVKGIMALNRRQPIPDVRTWLW